MAQLKSILIGIIVLFITIHAVSKFSIGREVSNKKHCQVLMGNWHPDVTKEQVKRCRKD